MSKELDIIKSDEYLNDFITRYGLSDAYVQDHMSIFKAVLESRALCKDCKGLYCCRQLSKGERVDLTYDGVLYSEIEYCDHALSKLEKERHIASFVYNDIPDNLQELYLEDLNYADDQRELYALMLGILHKQSDKGLYIYGDLGVGKTYMSIALANSLVDKGNKVAFVKVSSFFNEMRSYINSDPSMIDRIIVKLQRSDYLFLDDIGSEAVSDFVRDDILFRILDYRMENGLITMFTSNLDKDELNRHYTYDRKDKSNAMNAKRLMERIDILSEDYCLVGSNKRRI